MIFVYARALQAETVHDTKCGIWDASYRTYVTEYMIKQIFETNLKINIYTVSVFHDMDSPIGHVP